MTQPLPLVSALRAPGVPSTLPPVLTPPLPALVLIGALVGAILSPAARAEFASLPQHKTRAAPAASLAVDAVTDHKGGSNGDGDSAATAPKRKVLPVPPARPAPGRAALHKMIDRIADQHGLERDLVHAVVRAESGYNPHAVSPAGAVGIMQVMPATAADYGVSSTDALFDPQTNIRTGVRHLKRLVSRYGVGKAVMAYNAGEGALARHNGFVTYGETQRYTHQVLSSYLRQKGLTPYSPEAAALTGVVLTPAMATAAGGGRGNSAVAGRAGTGRKGRLLRRVDASQLSLRIRPTLSSRALDPAAHRLGPESQPMFVLEPRRPGVARLD